MLIPVDREAETPIYAQIHARLRHMIESGVLQPGERLPSIRSLAHAIQVNKLTVIEAYNRLLGDGLVESRPGSGYFVETQALPSPRQTPQFAPSQQVIIPSPRSISFFDLYRTMTQVQAQEAVIDFSGGYPNADGLDDLLKVTRRVSRNVPEYLLGYGSPEGQATLRLQVAHLLVQLGLEVSPEQLIITNGSMQALSLLVQHLLQPGDWVIVESPTYHGMLSILGRQAVRVIGIPMTAMGMNLTLLAQYLESHRPKLIYTTTTLHNPTGITTPLAHRQALLALAQQYDCLIIEDNAYEGLNFEPVPAPLKALDTDNRVIYTGTFSKAITPGLRVGYMVVTGEHYTSLVERRLLNDLHGSTLSQAVVTEYVAAGYYRRRLVQLQRRNLESRNVMLQALDQAAEWGCSWTVPKGGLFLWLQLPAPLSAEAICREALVRGVFVAPGSRFFPGQQGYPALRLCYALDPVAIAKGIAILTAVIRDACQALP